MAAAGAGAVDVGPTISSISGRVSKERLPLLPTLGYYLTFIHYFGFSINPNDVRSRHLSIRVKRRQNQQHPTASEGGRATSNDKNNWLSSHQIGTEFRGGGDPSSARRSSRGGRKFKKCLGQTLQTSVKLAAISFTTFLTLNHCVVLGDYIFHGSKAFLELLLEVRLVTTKFSALIFVLSWHKNQAKVRQLLKLVKSSSVYILSTQGFYGHTTASCCHQLEQQKVQLERLQIGSRWPTAAVCTNCSGRYLTPTRDDLRSVYDFSSSSKRPQQQQQPKRQRERRISSHEIGESIGFESTSLRVVTSRIDRRIVLWWLMCTCVTILHFSLSEAEINHSHHLWVWLDDYSLHQLNNQTISNSTLMFLASFDNYIYTVHVYGTRLIGASIICIVCSMQRENIDSLRWHALQLIQSSSSMGNHNSARDQLELPRGNREQQQKVAKFASNANYSAGESGLTHAQAQQQQQQQQRRRRRRQTTIRTRKAYCLRPNDNDCSKGGDNKNKPEIANMPVDSQLDVKLSQHASDRDDAPLAGWRAWVATNLCRSATVASIKTDGTSSKNTTTTLTTTANVDRELFFILGESDWLRVRENSRQLRPCGYLSASIWFAKRLLYGKASRLFGQAAFAFAQVQADFSNLRLRLDSLVAGRMKGARATLGAATFSAPEGSSSASIDGNRGPQKVASAVGPSNQQLVAAAGEKRRQRRAELRVACCGRCCRVGAASFEELAASSQKEPLPPEGKAESEGVAGPSTTTSLSVDGNADGTTRALPYSNSKAGEQSSARSAAAAAVATTSDTQKQQQSQQPTWLYRRDTPTPTCPALTARANASEGSSSSRMMMNSVVGVDTFGPTPSELTFGGRKPLKEAAAATASLDTEHLDSGRPVQVGSQVRVPNNESSNSEDRRGGENARYIDEHHDDDHDDTESSRRTNGGRSRFAGNQCDMDMNSRSFGLRLAPLAPPTMYGRGTAIQRQLQQQQRQLLSPAESTIEWQLEKLASKYELVRTVNARIDSCFGPMLLIQYSFLFLMSCIDLVYFSICFNPNTKTKYIIISGMILLWWPYLLLYKFASDIGSSSRQLLISVRRLARLSLIEHYSPDLQQIATGASSQRQHQRQLQSILASSATTIHRPSWRQKQANRQPQEQLIAAGRSQPSGRRHVHYPDEPARAEGDAFDRLQLPLAPAPPLGHNEQAFFAGRYSIFGGDSLASSSNLNPSVASNLTANYQWQLPPLRDSYGPGNYHWCSPAPFVSYSRRQTALAAHSGGGGQLNTGSARARLSNKLDHVFKSTNLSLVGIMTVDKFFLLNFAKIVITASVMMIQFISN